MSCDEFWGLLGVLAPYCTAVNFGVVLGSTANFPGWVVGRIAASVVFSIAVRVAKAVGV